jgi:hypothetical protein
MKDLLQLENPARIKCVLSGIRGRLLEALKLDLPGSWPGRLLGSVAVGMLLNSAHGAVTNIVHHWNFDEGLDWHDSPFQTVCTNTVAFDSAGCAHGTFQNMGSSNWVSGKQFTALAFDGVNQHLLAATNLANSFGGTASLSFWLRTVQTGAVSAATAPGVAGTVGAGGTQWGWLDEAGRIGLSVDNALVTRTASPVNDGKWHHVVLTRDSSTGTGQVYLDGALSGMATGLTGVRETAFTSLARIENGASSKYFAGRLDQIHVFNRVLSAAEVATLRTNHAPKCWDIATAGVTERAFSTASIFSRAYDVENDPLTVQSWTQPAHGTVTHNGDGSFTYTASGGYIGNDSFTVIVGDGQGGFHRANLNVNVMSEPPGGGGVPVTQFTDFATIQAGGVDITHNGMRVPRVLDWNNDGKPDLLIGAGGYVWCYTNNGTPAVPSFAPGVKVKATGVDIYVGTSSSPIALMDLTGDGMKDLVVADSASRLRVYRNTAAPGATPVYAAYVTVKHTNGTVFVMPDQRFDLGDWNGDGKPDLVTGTFSGDVKLFLNTGTATDPRFSTGTVLFSDSYQIYPRLLDLNGNGLVDLLRGINWGDIRYWRDAGALGLGSSMTFTIADAFGVSPDLHSLTDGAVVDFGDFNSDGKLDLVIGGQAGSANLFIAFGVQPSIADSIAEIEAIYDAYPTDVGVALSANNDALLNVVNNANWNLISHLQNGTLGTREALYAALTNHINKYWFLKYQSLDTTYFHHVPSIVLQNWVMLEYVLADTPTQRTNIANVMGLTGTMRTIFLETGLALGDNGKSIPAAYGTIRDFQRRHPRELFPDAVLTTDQLYGDGRGGFVWTPNSTKNTFGDWAVYLANEWAADLTAAIEKVLGPGAASGDYFTFVMGHEVTHSLDGYVNNRANKDLRRRWGLMLCTAAGPDVIPGADGWWDWTATKADFQAKGYWDGVAANWDMAWSNYWAVGYGATFKDLSFMRFDISWFLGAPQESLATQANHHWANGPGRLIGAVDRFRRATTTGLPPLKANINEVVTFIDFLSAGMNRVNLVETKTQSAPQQVNWFNHYADLERDDRGYIQRISVDGRSYDFSVNTNGVVTNVTTSLLSPKNDTVWTFRDTARQFDVLANDSRLEGGPVMLAGVTQPAHGSVVTNVNRTVRYTPALGYVGNDSFAYSVTSTAGGSSSATAFIEVVNPAAPTGTMLVEYWQNIGSGGAVSDLTGNPTFPNNPTVKYYTNSPFELRSNYGYNYGTRCRALLTPTVSGDYTFWIASDDAGELWFSPTSDVANKTLSAYLTSWAAPREWTKYASQKSAAIPLVAGQSYYLETLHKQGSGGDNLSVAWMGPAPFNTTNVIAAAYLKPPFSGFSAPRFNADPFTESGALLGVPYSSTLADNVIDTNANESLLFSKLSGPAWITVATSGNLTGMPGPGDLGTNTFTVRVIDSTGFTADATGRIFVATPPVIVPDATVAGGTLSFQFSGLLSQHYRVEFTAVLPASGPWQVLTDIVWLAESPFTVIDPTTSTQRFYRVSLIP